MTCVWCSDPNEPCRCMVHYSDPNHFAEEKPMAVNLRSSDPTRAGGGLQDIDEPSRGDDDALHYADDDEPPDRDEIIRLLTEELVPEAVRFAGLSCRSAH